MTKKVGQRIKELRESAGLTQKELGDKAGVSESYVGHIEGGRRESPSLPILIALCKALNYNLADLLLDIGIELSDTTDLEDWERQVLRGLRSLPDRQRELQIEQIKLLEEFQRKHSHTD